jgi:hypothetical protein
MKSDPDRRLRVTYFKLGCGSRNYRELLRVSKLDKSMGLPNACVLKGE